MRLIIEPQNEPFGEGNGWEPCEEKDATVWAVLDLDEEIGWAVEAFEKRENAVKFVKNLERESVS